MRQPKFRAWDTIAGEWCPSLIYLGKDGRVSVVDADGWANPAFILMQFTGLTDKAGNDIYEGDVVRTTSLLQSQRTTIDVVEWERDGFVLHQAGRIGRENRIEVIGNIYENPELLNEDRRPKP